MFTYMHQLRIMRQAHSCIHAGLGCASKRGRWLMLARKIVIYGPHRDGLPRTDGQMRTSQKT